MSPRSPVNRWPGFPSALPAALEPADHPIPRQHDRGAPLARATPHATGPLRDRARTDAVAQGTIRGWAEVVAAVSGQRIRRPGTDLGENRLAFVPGGLPGLPQRGEHHGEVGVR
jgi:hypothetical protein